MADFLTAVVALASDFARPDDTPGPASPKGGLGSETILPTPTVRTMVSGGATRQTRPMPRQPRFWFEGAVLHVMQRGNNRMPIFVDDADRLYFIGALLDATRRHGAAIHAYVLMSNHVHLLATPRNAAAMPRTMQTVGRRYVGRFNRVHGRSGTLWEGRYKATLVDADAYFFACMRYIESNPVRAGMVRAPRDYRWSSHAANAFGAADALVTVHPAYAALGESLAHRCEAYRSMCGDGTTDDELCAIRDATWFEWALGGEAFRRTVEVRTGRRTARLPMGPRQASR